jgi:hypothetical protein
LVSAGARLQDEPYLGPVEWTGTLPTLFAPSFTIDVLHTIVGDPKAVSDATVVLVHPTEGLRGVVDADQIAPA